MALTCRSGTHSHLPDSVSNTPLVEWANSPAWKLGLLCDLIPRRLSHPGVTFFTINKYTRIALPSLWQILHRVARQCVPGSLGFTCSTITFLKFVPLRSIWEDGWTGTGPSWLRPASDPHCWHLALSAHTSSGPRRRILIGPGTLTW